MADFVAANEGDDEAPEVGEEAEPVSASPAVAAAVSKIIDTSKIYDNLFRQLQVGESFQLAKVLQERNLLGTKKLLADFHKGAGYAAILRSMDQLAGRDRFKYLEVTAALSDSVIGLGALPAWRASLQTESIIGKIIKGPVFQVPAPPAWATDDFRKRLGFTVHRQVYMTDWLARIDVGGNLLSEISSRPVSLYRDYVGGLGDRPTRFELDSSLHAGLSVNGLLGADALSSDSVLEDPDLEVEVADRVDDLLTPQEAGRLDAVRDLRSVLASIDAKCMELLDGGWHVIHQASPAASEMAANCAVEAIDRAIRAAAPDSEVERWLPSSGRPEKEWRSTTTGRLTRAIRIRYIKRGYKDQAKMASTMVDSLISLQAQATERAQGIKHASAGDLPMARCLLHTAENILTMLFIIKKDYVL